MSEILEKVLIDPTVRAGKALQETVLELEDDEMSPW
jgi:hypothetical protein